MNATIDERGQIAIPAAARNEAGLFPGDVVRVEPQGDGRIRLIRLKRGSLTPEVRPQIIIRKGKHPVGDIGRPITREEIKHVLARFP